MTQIKEMYCVKYRWENGETGRNPCRFIPKFESRRHSSKHVGDWWDCICNRTDEFVQKELSDWIQGLVGSIEDFIGQDAGAIKRDGIKFAGGEWGVFCLAEVFSISFLDDVNNFTGIVYLFQYCGLFRVYMINRYKNRGQACGLGGRDNIPKFAAYRFQVFCFQYSSSDFGCFLLVTAAFKVYSAREKVLAFLSSNFAKFADFQLLFLVNMTLFPLVAGVGERRIQFGFDFLQGAGARLSGRYCTCTCTCVDTFSKRTQAMAKEKVLVY
jgi:hypothetical protein